MAELIPNNEDLAAALFSALGEHVPHPSALEVEAKRLISQIEDRESLLLKVIELCGNPQTPKQLYLTAKAYSWLGRKYDRQTIQFAEAYLNTEGWSELSNRTIVENGISMNHLFTQRASVFIDLAKAQEGVGRLEDALYNFLEAYRLEPYSAMNAVKAANVMVKLHGREEALIFLRRQKKSLYYSPTKYTDTSGNVRHNDEFRRLLDAHIFKLQEHEQTGK
jgi:hypothetical protein